MTESSNRICNDTVPPCLLAREYSLMGILTLPRGAARPSVWGRRRRYPFTNPCEAAAQLSREYGSNVARCRRQKTRRSKINRLERPLGPTKGRPLLRESGMSRKAARSEPKKSPTKFPWPGSSTQRVGVGFASLRKRPFDLLSQLRLDRIEVGAQLTAYALDRQDYRNPDACGNQSVFDGGSARLVSKKIPENDFQPCLLLNVGSVQHVCH